MKTFLAVFFAILAAAMVISTAVFLVTYIKDQSDRAAKLRELKESTLALAGLCKVVSPGGSYIKDVESRLEKDEDLIWELDIQNPGSGYRRDVFHNQLVAAGCFQPVLPRYVAPPIAVPKSRPLSKSARLELAHRTDFYHAWPGHILDFIIPIDCGGTNADSNTRWLTEAQAAAKEKNGGNQCKK